MKLLHYTYYKLMLLIFILMGAWGILFFSTIMYEVTDETDDTLRNNSNILINHVLHNPDLLGTTGTILAPYSFRAISDHEGRTYHERFFDSTVYIEIEDEHEPVRVMQTAFQMHDGQYYELEMKLSTLERDNMERAIVWYLVALFTLFLVGTLVGTQLVLRSAFRPLNRLMQWLQSLHPGKPVPPLESDTHIREFQLLADAAVEMGNRSYKAYEEQKQFIENASHELQTPLAIARGKVELLADSDTLDEQQLRELSEIYDTLGRAVRLNKSLLLLTRIENGQYDHIEQLNIDTLLDELLDDLLDIYESKHIDLVRTAGEPPLLVHGNRTLIQILLTNLVKNALLHNVDGGQLRIDTTPASLTIKNSGEHPLDPDGLFRRFYRDQNAKADSTGLGLAIAHTIAVASSLTLTYRWDAGMHLFTLSKPDHTTKAS
ncbi:MAG: HAMP domain-containing histidine kinase [Prevotellaceae bacterium]|jgi:signal transduction histidine kinase|nr:HAMP domain-containing histidine kinase [Prevotellaceae bacterium]